MGLIGAIPAALAQCTCLETLELQENKFFGLLPPALWKLGKLQILALHGNVLCGEVSGSGVMCLTLLTTLTLGGEAGGNEELFVSRTPTSLPNRRSPYPLVPALDPCHCPSTPPSLPCAPSPLPD